MKKIKLWLGALAVAAFSFNARAGSISYVGIPATGSDAGSGLGAGNTYTSAVNGGNTSGADRVVNGVPLAALVGSGGASTAGNVTFTASSGALANAGGANANIAADGVLLSVLSTATFVHGASGDAAHTIALDPASLAAGTTYDLRVYIGSWSGQNRMVNLTFSGDGQDPASTDFFNEDDATSSAGGFGAANQVYYIDYQFTWDGTTTPTISVAEKDAHIPFHLYALTNQVVSAPNNAAPATGGEAVQTAAPVSDTDTAPVSSDTFYTPLQSSGDWISVSGYGNCWQPSGVSQGWRPYTNGYWAHTDCGWTWVSNESWGWATYHYGRWTFIDGTGWVWVPGRVWAPAWVSWRYGGGSVGWAPLPPAARFAAGVGISIWADSSYGIGPSAYNFCAVRDFGSPNLGGVVYPRERNASILNNTTNITNIVYNTNNTTVYNGGPSLATVNAAITRGGGRPVPTLVLNRQQTVSPAAAGKFSQVQGNQLSLVAPRVIPKQKAANLPKITRTIATPHIDHGWSGITDPKVAAQLKAKVATEAKGKTPLNTHAQLPKGLPVVKPAVVKTSAILPKTAVATPAPAQTPRMTGKGKHAPSPTPAPDPASTPARALSEGVVTHAPTPTPTPKRHHGNATPVPTPAPKANPALEHFDAAPKPTPTPQHTPKEHKEAVTHTPTPKPEAVHVPTPKPEVVHVPTTKPAVVHTPTPPPHPKELQEEEKKKEEEKKDKGKPTPTP